MTNMWSDKKWVNITINVLLFLVAINFIHLGQLLLPIICLILFIDNKFKFKVNSVFTFVVLCLFAISFCAFSYQLGFYCVMGFCLPMAYYIGSNLKEVNEDNIKKIIYIVIIGMCCHAILNCIYDFYKYGLDIMMHLSRWDFWIKDKIAPTANGSLFVLLFSIAYYVTKYEKNKFTKLSFFVLYVLMFLYALSIGRRSPFLLVLISLLVSLYIDRVNINIKNISIEKILIGIMFFIGINLALYTIGINIYHMIIQKIKIHGFSSGRLEILIESIANAPKYIWGGQLLSNNIGNQPHNLWLDIYDYAGIIPFILIIIYSIKTFINCRNVMRSNKISSSIKLLILEVLLCIVIEMCMEPVMTGLSIFLICSIIMIAAIEKVLENNTK